MTIRARPARKPITHEVHGIRRADDYHWLKTQGRADPEVRAHLEGENAFLAGVMAPHRELQEALYAELLSHVQERDDQPDVVRGPHAYFQRTLEGLAHPVFMRRAVAGGPDETLLDMNALTAREHLANVWVYTTAPSPDGRYWAYLMDTTGQEVWELRVLDTHTGELADAPLHGVSGWVLAWSADGTQVYYATEDATQRPHRIWRHTLGHRQEDDDLLYQEDDVTFGVAASVTENGAFLRIAADSRITSEWWVMPTDDAHARPSLLLARERATEVPRVTDGGDHWLALTNQGGADEFRVVRFAKRADGLALQWADAQDVIPHDPGRYVTGLHVFRRHLLISGREEGFTRVWVMERVAGGGYGPARRVEFPDAASTVRIGANHVFDTPTARITYTSMVRPPEHLDLNLDTLETTLVKATPVPGYDADAYVTEQVWATAPDGERIPVSVVRRRDTALPAPTMLHGYGSYGYSMDPSFSVLRVPMLDRGWVWATPHIRGGSELGRRWYDAGRLAHKKNTFTDFIAAGEALRAQGTASDLVALGGSAGGLLTGAAVNLRPELWTAAFVLVPFVDVLSTMLDDRIPLTTAEYDEWGNPNDAGQYAVMAEYSPYDNLKAVRYPHLFVSTGLNDPRVAYWEPAKYAARVRDVAQPGSGVTVLKTNMEAGHSGASGRYEYLNESAEHYAFALAAVAGTLPRTDD